MRAITKICSLKMDYKRVVCISCCSAARWVEAVLFCPFPDQHFSPESSSSFSSSGGAPPLILISSLTFSPPHTYTHSLQQLPYHLCIPLPGPHTYTYAMHGMKACYLRRPLSFIDQPQYTYYIHHTVLHSQSNLTFPDSVFFFFFL